MGLREQLQAIYDQHGKLTPELVREEARPKGHPLHDRVFDRPKGEAAEAWYLRRAHELIRKVRVRDTRADEEGEEPSEAPVGPNPRAFQAIRSEGPDTYIYEPTEKVAKDEFAFKLLMREMEREQKQLTARQEEFIEYVTWLAGGEEAQAA